MPVKESLSPMCQCCVFTLCFVVIKVIRQRPEEIWGLAQTSVRGGTSTKKNIHLFIFHHLWVVGAEAYPCSQSQVHRADVYRQTTIQTQIHTNGPFTVTIS